MQSRKSLDTLSLYIYIDIIYKKIIEKNKMKIYSKNHPVQNTG